MEEEKKSDKKETVVLGEYAETTESIEEHYAKMYKDLPNDVVKMLISTHPLYGDKDDISEPLKEETYKETNHEIEEEIYDEPKKIKSPIEKEPKKVKSPIEKESKESIKKVAKISDYSKVSDDTKEVDVKPIKEKVHKAPKNEILSSIEDDYEDEDEDDEKDVLHSLFSEKSDNYNSNFKRNLLICILTSIFLVCIIGLVVNIIQTNKTKAEIEALKTDNNKLTTNYNNLTVEKESIANQNRDLILENESLHNQLVDLSPQETQENVEQQPNVEETTTQQTTKSTEKTTSQKQTSYVVQKGDTLWKISIKMYGTGSYYKKIMEANNLSKDTDAKVGMTLIIPKI